MPSQKGSTNQANTSLGTSAIGATFGVLTAGLAQNMAGNDPNKGWLTLAAPVVTALISSGVFWAKTKFDENFRHRENRTLISSTKEALKQNMDDPLISEETRSLIKRYYQDIILLEISGNFDRLEVLNETFRRDSQRMLGNDTQTSTHDQRQIAPAVNRKSNTPPVSSPDSDQT